MVWPGEPPCFVTSMSDLIRPSRITRSSADNIAFVFPGQGAQSTGMSVDFIGKYPHVRDTFDEASQILGFDLIDLIRNGPEATLNKTEYTQPALLTAGVAVWRLWGYRNGIMPCVMAGHSLGEYTALVCGGSISFTDAVLLVRDRGRYMQEAVADGEGRMAAILGLDDEIIESVCSAACAEGFVAPANFNAPGQVVIAGTVPGIAAALRLAREAGARKTMELQVSVPSHCALMKSAADKLSVRLKEIQINDCMIPVIQNVDAQARTSGEEIRHALVGQLHQPVRWVDTIKRLEKFDCRVAIESGPGRVISGLIKRINRDIEAVALTDVVAFENIMGSFSHENQP